MCELLDFFAHRRIGRLTQSRCAVAGGARYGDEDVRFRPLAFAHDTAELVEIDFELSGAMCKGRAIIGDARVGLLAE
nr:hypothetical protein [Limnobacter sp. SAORIC-690]